MRLRKFIKTALISMLLAMAITTTSNIAKAAGDNTINITFSPLLALVGWLDLAIDYKLTDHLNVGVMGTSWNISVLSESWNISGFGLRAFWHFDKANSDGWFLGPMVRSSSMKVTTQNVLNSTTLSANASIMSYGAVAGYQWMWSSFNQSLGVTYGATSATQLEYSDGTKVNIPSSATGAGLYYYIGWAF